MNCLFLPFEFRVLANPTCFSIWAFVSIENMLLFLEFNFGCNLGWRLLVLDRLFLVGSGLCGRSRVGD